MGIATDVRDMIRRAIAPRDRHVGMNGRVVLVSGGARGLGLELAREFGRRGSLVAICARDAAEVERAEADLTARGIDVIGLVGDIRDESDVKRMTTEVVRRWGPVDVLVNNAGIIQVGPLDALARADYRDAMDTHFWGPLNAIDAVLPSMRARRSGRILNIASIGGRVSVPHLLPYSASKFALLGLSEGLRAELVRERVYVTTVVPGLMRTGSPENAEFKGRHRAEYAWFSVADSLPLLSVGVVEAARAIVDAAERGDAECTLSIPAKVASIVHGVAPSAVVEVLGVIARVLPSFGGIDRASRAGRESHSAVSPSPLTIANQRSSISQNEVAL